MGVRVCVMVWHDISGTGTGAGLLGTHCQQTDQYFHGTGVQVLWYFGCYLSYCTYFKSNNTLLCCNIVERFAWPVVGWHWVS